MQQEQETQSVVSGDESSKHVVLGKMIQTLDRLWKKMERIT